MLNVTISDREVSDLLTYAHGRIKNMRPVMEAIGQEMQSLVSGRFETETDPNGVHWAPWAPSTEATYPANGNRRILDRYGDMLASLNYKATASSTVIGFGMPYATFHEWGTQTMPRRGILTADPDEGTLGEEDQEAVIDMIQSFLLFGE